jgi:hypothetical protein
VGDRWRIWGEGDFPKEAGMEEISGIILGAVLPIYPILFVIHQRIGRYDEIVEEFKRLRDEHEHMKEAYHGN